MSSIKKDPAGSASSIKEYQNRSASESHHIISNILPGKIKIRKISFAEEEQERLSIDLSDM